MTDEHRHADGADYEAELTEAQRNANTALEHLTRAAAVRRPDDAAAMALVGVGFAILSLDRQTTTELTTTTELAASLPFAQWPVTEAADLTVSDLPGTGNLLHDLGSIRLDDLSAEQREDLHRALQDVVMEHLPAGTPAGYPTPPADRPSAG